MTQRRPLVRVDGETVQLPAGDTVAGAGGTVTSVALSMPAGFSTSGSPVTTSGTLTVTYATGYQGFTTAQSTKLAGIATGATVGATWGTNLFSIPSNITSWASSSVGPADVVTLANSQTVSGDKEFSGNSNRFSGASGVLLGTGNARLRADANGVFIRFGTTDYFRLGADGFFRNLISGFESSSTVVPNADNYSSVGSASRRWGVMYAATGTINTSDAREKTPVRELTAAEIAAAIELGREIGAYRWLTMVQEKGELARQHIGMTVQGAVAILEAHGLDPFAYGFICFDEWDEQQEIRHEWSALPQVVDDFGNLLQEAMEAGFEVVQEYRPAGNRYSFRMDELLAFIARGLAHQVAAIERRLNQAGL